MNNCAAAGYKRADAELNKIYGRIMQDMSDDLARAQREGDRSQIKYEQTGIANLKKSERAWLSYRRMQCDAAAQRYLGGSMMPMVYSECLMTLTEQRVAGLKRMYELDDPDHDIRQ